MMLFTMTSVAQELRNPIIGGYHPDPSVTRVGKYFYLVNSSFQYFPGVPIYRSEDLVHWQQIGNVLTSDSQLPLKGASSWLGIYAPTIRYNAGRWYMITTNVGNGGNFMVTADRPEGPWSQPLWLTQQGIDPSLYFEQGKCYMVSNPDNTIILCEIDPATGQQLTESRPIWRGTGGRYPEGPHIYNKDGYYYLLISEGGTELAHSLTIARSKSIYGPYEANPNNPIMTNCRMAGQDKQIQGTGHGDLMQAEDGSWWLTFLAYRNFGGSYHHLGRETCLAPVEWREGEWPVVNGGNAIDTLMTVPKLLTQTTATAQSHDKLYDFKAAWQHGERLGAEWLYIQNPIPENYEWGAWGIRLHGSKSSLTVNEQPTFVGRRQESGLLTASCRLCADGLQKGDEAGMTVYQINNGHLDLFVRRNESNLLEIVLRYQIKSIVHEEKIIPIETDGKKLSNTSTVKLTITSDGNTYDFYMEHCDAQKPAQQTTEKLGSVESSMVSTEVVGGFTGVVLGMYATGNGYADFENFVYKESVERPM